MTYSIEYERKALKQILELDRLLKRRIITAIEKLPQGDIKKLSGYSANYRLRVGDYRIIYSISGNILTIEAVLHRRQAYQNY